MNGPCLCLVVCQPLAVPVHLFVLAAANVDNSTVLAVAGFASSPTPAAKVVVVVPAAAAGGRCTPSQGHYLGSLPSLPAI